MHGILSFSTDSPSLPVHHSPSFVSSFRVQVLLTPCQWFFSAFLHSTYSLSESLLIFSLARRLTRIFTNVYRHLLLINGLLTSDGHITTGLSPCLALLSIKVLIARQKASDQKNSSFYNDSLWAFGFSLAATNPIDVSFFSCAY